MIEQAVKSYVSKVHPWVSYCLSALRCSAVVFALALDQVYHSHRLWPQGIYRIRRDINSIQLSVVPFNKRKGCNKCYNVKQNTIATLIWLCTKYKKNINKVKKTGENEPK